jgi:ketosteroid isomerase-like protein
MDDGEAVERPLQPEDLDRLFLQRANAGDVDGVVGLYEADAVLAFPPGHLAVGRPAIREVYADLLAGRPQVSWLRGGQCRISAVGRAVPPKGSF